MKAVDKKVNYLKNLAGQNIENALNMASEREKCFSIWASVASTIGPILLGLLYCFFPININNPLQWNTFLDVAVTILLIILFLFLTGMARLYQRVITKISISKEALQKEIVSLKERISSLNEHVKSLNQDKIFYSSAAELISRSIKQGTDDQESLSQALMAAIYHDLSVSHSTGGVGDNITLNLYELRNGIVKMITSNTRLRYCERGSINSPLLFNHPDGISITESTIQDYFCIRCMRGKVKDRRGVFFIPDWQSLVSEFKWDGWSPSERDNILKTDDLNKCRDNGFMYNQYVAFVLRLNDNATTVFFEIIANEETLLASPSELLHTARFLMEKYSPMLSILWSIS